MQIRDYFFQLLLIQLVSEWRHHASAAHNTLHYMFIGGSQAAGQVRLLVQLLEPWSFVPAGRIRVMTRDAVNIEDLSTVGLPGVQSQFSIGHLCGIFGAARQQTGQSHHQKNGRHSTQVTIMSVAWRFENPWRQYYRQVHAG